MKTLRDWLPKEFFFEWPDSPLHKWLDVEVSKEGDLFKDRHPFKHRHIHSWCVLANGIAVGWNENPAIGWSFPHKRLIL